MKKKLISLLLCVCMTVGVLVGCGGSNTGNTEANSNSSNEETSKQPSEGTETEEETEKKNYTTFRGVGTGYNKDWNGQADDGTRVVMNLTAFFDFLFTEDYTYPIVPELAFSSEASSGMEVLESFVGNSIFNRVIAGTDQKAVSSVADVLIYSISYDGTTYTSLNVGDEIEIVDNMRIACRLKVGYQSNTVAYSDKYKECILVLEYDETSYDDSGWLGMKPIGLYSTDYVYPYFTNVPPATNPLDEVKPEVYLEYYNYIKDFSEDFQCMLVDINQDEIEELLFCNRYQSGILTYLDGKVEEIVFSVPFSCVKCSKGENAMVCFFGGGKNLGKFEEGIKDGYYDKVYRFEGDKLVCIRTGYNGTTPTDGEINYCSVDDKEVSVDAYWSTFSEFEHACTVYELIPDGNYHINETKTVLENKMKK